MFLALSCGHVPCVRAAMRKVSALRFAYFSNSFPCFWFSPVDHVPSVCAAQRKVSLPPDLLSFRMFSYAFGCLLSGPVTSAGAALARSLPAPALLTFPREPPESLQSPVCRES